MTASSPHTRAQLFARLDELGLTHRTVEHQPIMTVDEGRAFKESMPGGHSKNLFLKDKKGTLFLVTAHCDTEIDLVALGRHLGAKGRVSFGKPDLMVEKLGVAPGSVTPFAMINAVPDTFAAVVVDQAFFDHDPVWFHPLKNDASTAIAADDLIVFLKACGVEPLILPLGAIRREA